MKDWSYDNQTRGLKWELQYIKSTCGLWCFRPSKLRCLICMHTICSLYFFMCVYFKSYSRYDVTNCHHLKLWGPKLFCILLLTMSTMVLDVKIKAFGSVVIWLIWSTPKLSEELMGLVLTLFDKWAWSKLSTMTWLSNHQRLELFLSYEYINIWGWGPVSLLCIRVPPTTFVTN